MNYILRMHGVAYTQLAFINTTSAYIDISWGWWGDIAVVEKRHVRKLDL